MNNHLMPYFFCGILFFGILILKLFYLADDLKDIPAYGEKPPIK